MKSAPVILALILMLPGCASVNSLPLAMKDRILQPEQTSLMPKQGVDYRLVVPPLMYQTKEPGPEQRGARMAWDLANEFAYRTALREYVTLPASSVGGSKDAWYVVNFDGPNGQPAGSVIVNIAERTVAVDQ